MSEVTMNKRLLIGLLSIFISFAPSSKPVYAGTWLLGGGVEYLPQPVLGFDEDYNFVPLVLYIGKYFRLLGDTFQLSVAGNPTLSMDITGTIRRMGYEIPGRERRKAFDMGLGWLYNKKPHRARLEIIGDITGSHNGYAINAYWLTEFKLDQWQIGPRIEIMWESDKVADYYYGTNTYKGESAFYQLAGLEVNYNINKKWTVTSEFSIKNISAINNSPIVDTDIQYYGFIGVMYIF